METMVGVETRIADLLEKHPELEDFLVGYHPAFKGLKSSFLRKTVGKIATVGKAASIAGVTPEELVAAIKEQLGRASEGPSREERREQLKQLLRDLHAGAAQDDIQVRFNEFAAGMDATEIAAIEQELVAEGLPEEEIKGLCDFHARLMGGAVHEAEVVLPEGHPCHTLKLENAALEAQAVRLETILAEVDGARVPAAVRSELQACIDALGTLELHYQRKENQFFPYLEKHDITAPPPVMWAVHDDIRGQFKLVRQAFANGDGEALKQHAADFIHNFREMVFKEEKILIPMCLDTFSLAEWYEIRKGEPDIGFALVEPVAWQPTAEELGEDAGASGPVPGKAIPLDTGLLLPPQINMMLKALPVDLTFVDENDEVRYFSDTAERVFPRSPGIVGRKVQNCHPRKSLHMVQDILDAFRAGNKETAEFWIQMGGRFIHIRYFALRDPLGKYRGCLEVSQDVTDIRALQGERRLLQWGEE